jgi:hypothetical protein
MNGVAGGEAVMFFVAFVYRLPFYRDHPRVHAWAYVVVIR